VVERPYFDDVSPRNVTVVVGQPALLKCRVRHIGNRTVSTLVLDKNNLLVNLGPSSARLFIIKITWKLVWENNVAADGRFSLVYVTLEATRTE
jgi:hypothetical protein